MLKKPSLIVLWVALLILCNAVMVCNASKGREEFIPAEPEITLPDSFKTFEPQTFGAKGDGFTDDGAAIQAAIDTAEVNSGGIVVLKDGTFLSSPLKMKSGVYLKVEASALLKAVPYQDYPKRSIGFDSGEAWDYPNRECLEPFISANGVMNFGIIGDGTIEGNGERWWQELRAAKGTDRKVKRPLLICFFNSRNIYIKGIRLINSPEWNLTVKNCENVAIRNVTIKNPSNSPNTDGINPSGSKNVYIDGCVVDTGDDNIAIKAHNGVTKNVFIKNCTFYFGHGLSIGSETYHGVQNVYVENCKFVNTTTGIRLKSGRDRGNVIKNIHYRDITMEDVGSAVVITAYYPKPAVQGDAAQKLTAFTPKFTDISIVGLNATAQREAGMIMGLPEQPIRGLKLKDVLISAPVGLKVRNAQIKASNTTIVVAQGPNYIAEENSDIVER
ncbi:MAG: Polygalacturonase [Firmicutes bacterium]|nr:Polygalacturonase [Bacillota bacterium]